MATNNGASILERMREIDDTIGRAAVATEGDREASAVLAAVVKEFQSKSTKSLERLDGGADPAVEHECIIELEQAGDSAKAAAEADSGASETTRQAVLDAHLAICMLKAGV